MDSVVSIHQLDVIIEQYYELNRVSNAPIEEAREFVNLLHWRLKSNPLFGRNCRVDMFGSMRNGLWTTSSDVDICVRFEKDDVDIPFKEMAKYIRQIRYIVQALKCEFVQYIMCRIPLVKFAKYEDGEGLHGDICFLNGDAIHNSNLLNAYSKWDNRYVMLGLFLKKWVSVCQIGSGEQGYPSSFSWTLMLVQFLQNTSPKVLPNIQKDFIDEDFEIAPPKKEQNTYFHKQVKPNWSKNEKTVGALFIEFLDYYSKYDFVKQTIQIHKKEPIAKPKSAPTIVFVDPISYETRECYDEFKFRYITEVVIPEWREALTLQTITAEIGSTLEDVDNILKEFMKSNIGKTFKEFNKAKKAELLKNEDKFVAAALDSSKDAVISLHQFETIKVESGDPNNKVGKSQLNLAQVMKNIANKKKTKRLMKKSQYIAPLIGTKDATVPSNGNDSGTKDLSDEARLSTKLEDKLIIEDKDRCALSRKDDVLTAENE